VIILDIPRRFDGDFIEVPSFHRTHVSLFPGTEVHMCAFAGAPHAAAEPGRYGDPLPELVVSPIDFRTWARVYRLTGTFRDRSGLINDVLRVLSDHHVDIASCETSNTREHPRRESIHSLEALVILDESVSPAHHSDFSAERLRTRVEWALQAYLFDDLVLRPNGQPRLSLQPVASLHDAAHAYRRVTSLENLNSSDAVRATALVEGFSEFRTDGTASSSVEPFPNAAIPKKRPGKIPDFLSRRAKVVLPTGVSQLILAALHAERPKNAGYYIRMSDTKDRTLRVLFSRHDHPIVNVRVLHGPTPQATFLITKALRDARFDILSSFISPSTVSMYESLSGSKAQAAVTALRRASGVFELTLRYDGDDYREIHGAENTANVKARVRDALASDTCAGLLIDIAFPKNYSKHWELDRVQPPRGAKRVFPAPAADESVAPAGAPVDPTPLYDKYMAAVWKYRSVHTVEGPLPSVAVAPTKVALANRLNEIYVREQLGTSSNSRHILFISSHFSRPGLLVSIEKEAQLRLLKPVVARDTQAFESKRSAIVERIRGCTYFLGVWDVDGALQIGASYWPSPWLLWEFGVAEALGIPWRLLVSDKIHSDSYAKISMDRQHYIFEGVHDFQHQLETAMDHIAADPRKR
jgi:hypothetical protein